MAVEVAVCDDESKDLENVVRMLSEIFEEEKVPHNIQAFSSSADMLAQAGKIDIAILDIVMGEMNGINLGRELKSRFPKMRIIYMTNYEEYCMQAINEIHAFSFLCKPLSAEALKSQIDELIREIEQSGSSVEKAFYKVFDGEGREHPVIKLPLDSIICFEYIKTKRRTKIVLRDRTYEYFCVMEDLARELEKYGFAVNCRGNLVNLRHIVKIKGYNIYLDNGQILSLAQKRTVQFKEKLNEFIHSCV